MPSSKRVCILIHGHLATTPRMLKAADALADAGHAVRVVSTRSTEWADDADADVVRRRPGAWAWETIDYRRQSRSLYVRSGIRQKISRVIIRSVGVDRVPLRVAAAARDRVFPELVAKVCEIRPDIVYGGGGSLAATACAAKKMGVPYAIDLEDFHSADHFPTPDGRFANALAERIERDLIGGAALRTGGSDAISAAYSEKYSVSITTINNTFPVLPPVDQDLEPHNPLRLFWFSQTIGAGRGLDDVVLAAGMAAVPLELHLQGQNSPDYARHLLEMQRRIAPQLKLFLHAPARPDEVVANCQAYDVGLAVEESLVAARALSLSNKSLSYVAAGIAVALTDTPGQRPLAQDLGPGALLFKSGDVQTLAKGLRKWSDDRIELARSKAASRNAAKERWNWNNVAGKRSLVEAITRAM